jgi:purine-binding chemotaxis protein CheW
VKVELARQMPQQSQVEDEFLDQIVWYNDKNLYIFSPTKISKIVNRELRNQLVANQVRNHETEDETEEQTDSNSIDYLIAKIRQSYIAIEITKVIEVIEEFEVTSLYKVSNFIRGLINLRGQVLACIDLSKHLGFDLLVIDERNKFIVISESGSDFALCVDELIGIKALDGRAFQGSEKVFPETVAEFFPSFFEENGDLNLIMKPELFVNSESLINYRKK